VAAIVLFKWIACSTVMATLLVFLIILAKLILKNKLGAKWHYLIWMLVLIKLLIPFGPQSQFSIYNLFNLTDQKITEKSYDVIDRISTATTSIAKNTPIPALNATENQESSAAGHEAGKIVYLSLLGLFIWFTGAASVALYMYRKNLKTTKELEIGKAITDKVFLDCLNQCKKTMGVKADIMVKGVSGLKTPALYGIFNPVLLIPLDMLNECSVEQIKYAVYHELAHLKRRDIPINFLLSVLLAVHWFNPLIWYAFYKIRQDIELACDEYVLSCLNPSEHKNYGLAMIYLVEKFSSGIRLSNAVGFLGKKSLIKKRISMIASYRKKSFRLSVMAAFVFVVLVISVFTNAVESFNL
jgi:beta-lactamase regulating signal transducer with metallopeptidase domain